MVKTILLENKCTFSEIGIFSGDQIIFESNSTPIVKLRVDKAENNYLKFIEGNNSKWLKKTVV